MEKKRDVDIDIRSQTFLSITSDLNDDEKRVLRVLIKQHKALAIRTLRGYMVLEAASKNAQRLFKIYQLDNYNELKHFTSTSHPEWSENIKRQKKALEIYVALKSDVDVIAAGETPINISKKITLLEKVMREKLTISIPAWGSINKAITELVVKGMVIDSDGDLPGQKKGKVYSVAPKIYLLWEQKFDKIRDAKNKSQEEKEWFDL